MAPDLLFDPLGRREILLAPERARRGAPRFEADVPDPEPCDFCGGRESRTPPETFSIRRDGSAPDSSGWVVRVVPNLYPATPFHEVVVHTPEHHARFEDQDIAHRVDVLKAYRARAETAPTAAVVPVWNRGRVAGASRTHEHGQIFGLDDVPPTLRREQETFTGDRCVLCDIAADEVLCVVDIEGFRIVAHPVPFVADELLIVPPHGARFDALPEDVLPVAAEAIAAALRRTLANLGDSVPFNLVVHTAPRGVDRFHWHAHLMPRTAVWGGLEMGAELPIVAADPYETARRLKSV